LNFPFYIAKRYLFAPSSNNAINIITMIASSGVIVGTAALFIILSGFSGLRTFNDSLLDTSDPDIKVSPAKGKSFLFTNVVQKTIADHPSIAQYCPVIEERAFLKSDDKQQIAYVKGVEYNYVNVVKLDSALQIGTWLDPEYSNTAVIGNGLAFKLSLGIMNFGEPLEIVVPKTGTGFLNPNSTRTIQTQIIGVYSGTEEFQNKYVFVSNAQAQKLLDYERNQFSAVEIKLKSDVDPDDFAKDLQKILGTDFKVQTKAQLNELFFKVINTENFVSYLIFTLIMIIAMFNVIGAIIMMIIDKKKNLKTIINLGATLKEVKRIFVLQGFLLTLAGMTVGLFIAVALVSFQQQFEWFMITATIPYPVELQFSNVLIVTTTISVLGFLAAKIASSRISTQFLES
jgi:lipoprotein-releasing system permease protein